MDISNKYRKKKETKKSHSRVCYGDNNQAHSCKPYICTSTRQLPVFRYLSSVQAEEVPHMNIPFLLHQN